MSSQPTCPRSGSRSGSGTPSYASSTTRFVRSAIGSLGVTTSSSPWRVNVAVVSSTSTDRTTIRGSRDGTIRDRCCNGIDARGCPDRGIIGAGVDPDRVTHDVVSAVAEPGIHEVADTAGTRDWFDRAGVVGGASWLARSWIRRCRRLGCRHGRGRGVPVVQSDEQPAPRNKAGAAPAIVTALRHHHRVRRAIHSSSELARRRTLPWVGSRKRSHPLTRRRRVPSRSPPRRGSPVISWRFDRVRRQRVVAIDDDDRRRTREARRCARRVE